MKRILFTAGIFSIMSMAAMSQNFINFSAADEYLLRKKISENPQLKEKYIEYTEQRNVKTDTFINGRRIIPVVFHIIHKYGVENISDEQVYDAIEKLNIDYNKLNADTTETYPLFKSRSADCQIEFRLAKIDPNGNCTNGIDRIYDKRTDYAYYPVMHDYAWTPSHYLNIYAVNYIYPEGMTLPEGAFIGGMSPFPPSNPLSSTLTGGDTLVDGVLIRQDCIGTIGTATEMAGMPINQMNRTLTHESGHYFNLYHPFNLGLLCILSDGCGPSWLGCGDEVDDTPPVQAATQNTDINCFPAGSRNTCTSTDAVYGTDAPDMVENYMDYQWGKCTNLFTLDQLDRINTTMSSDRAKLWSLENLIATGVLDTNASVCAPRADFNCTYKTVCSGASITFTDFSYNNTATSWDWTFDGGTPASATSQSPNVTYNTPGVYDVKLKVSNGFGSDSLIKQGLITVLDPTNTVDAPFVEGFESSISTWMINNDAGNSWEVTDSGSYSGNQSLWISNFSNNAPNSYDEIITPAIDFTTFSPAPNSLFLRFKLAYTGHTYTNPLTQVTDSIWDNLLVYASTDCGRTWIQRYSKSGASLATTSLITSRFFPTSASQWREEAININNIMTDDNARFKFVLKSGGGNNIFIDDINIYAGYTGVEDSEPVSEIKIVPNPVNETTMLSFGLLSPTNVKAEIINMLGEEIAVITEGFMDSGDHNISISKASFGEAGCYWIKLTAGGKCSMQKVVVL